MTPIFPSKPREEANRFVAERVKNWHQLHVLEVGTIRSRHAAVTDGHSTLFLRSLLDGRIQASLVSVDKNPACVVETMAVFEANGLSGHRRVHLVCGDAVSFLRDFPCALASNLVMLDGLDYYDKKASEEFHLECFRMIDCSLVSGALVVVDDNMNPDTHEGKGRLICERAVGMGYKIIHNSYQVVLEKE